MPDYRWWCRFLSHLPGYLGFEPQSVKNIERPDFKGINPRLTCNKDFHRCAITAGQPCDVHGGLVVFSARADRVHLQGLWLRCQSPAGVHCFQSTKHLPGSRPSSPASPEAAIDGGQASRGWQPVLGLLVTVESICLVQACQVLGITIFAACELLSQALLATVAQPAAPIGSAAVACRWRRSGSRAA